MNTLKNRVVVIIFYKNGNIVQSKNFKQHKIVGDPYLIIERLTAWNADEVIYLNIRPDLSDINRQDKNIKYLSNFDEIIRFVGKRAFMPLTVGGGIKKLEDAEKYFRMGADKISVNSILFDDPGVVYQCSKKFGSQAIVGSIDLKIDKECNYHIYKDCGKTLIKTPLRDYLMRIEDNGVGELLINNIDRDGMANGYDLSLLKFIKKYTKLPIIFAGGVGKFEDLFEGIQNNINAVAAGNIFHHTENSYYEAMNFLYKKQCSTRPPVLFSL